MAALHQGDILKIEKIKHPVLVASKDFFNTSGEIIGCPIIKDSMPGPLHIWMSTGRKTKGIYNVRNLHYWICLFEVIKNRPITYLGNDKCVGCYSEYF